MPVTFQEPKDTAFTLEGGFDQSTSHLLLKPGQLIAGKKAVPPPVKKKHEHPK
jgi:hypothetical protein